MSSRSHRHDRRCWYCRQELLRGIGLCWECWRLAIIAALATKLIDWLI